MWISVRFMLSVEPVGLGDYTHIYMHNWYGVPSPLF